jgi:hypothetical protein
VASNVCGFDANGIRRETVRYNQYICIEKYMTNNQDKTRRNINDLSNFLLPTCILLFAAQDKSSRTSLQ